MRFACDRQTDAAELRFANSEISRLTRERDRAREQMMACSSVLANVAAGMGVEVEALAEDTSLVTRERDEQIARLRAESEADRRCHAVYTEEVQATIAELRSQLADRDTRLARVATWDTEVDKHGRPGPWCACCQSSQHIAGNHDADCPCHGLEAP